MKNKIYNNLHEKIPISEAIFESIIANSPLTSESLRYRLPLICKNEIDIDMTRSMIGADSDGPLIVMFFGERYSEIFPKEIYCRIFCGSLKKDDEIHLMDSKEKIKVMLQQEWERGAEQRQSNVFRCSPQGPESFKKAGLV